MKLKSIKLILVAMTAMICLFAKAETHEYVDLGLPSGTLWATENINTKNVLYGWGDVTGADLASGSNAALVVNTNTPYVTVTMDDGDHVVSAASKYTTTDGLTTLEDADDAAYQAWGSEWRMPTKAEFEELINNCTVSISSGVATLTGPNGKTITFALGKFSDGDEVVTSSSNAGYYWTSTSVGDQYFSAYSAEFKLVSGSSYISLITSPRIWGSYIRPVSVTKAPPYTVSEDGTVLNIKEGTDIATVVSALGTETSTIKELYVVGDYTTTASINALKTSYFSNLQKVHLTLVTESDAIAASAYASCSLLYDITIPENVTSIADGAFTDYDDYRRMTFPSATPATLSSASALPSKWLVYVPADAVDTYKNTEYWSDHASQIVAIGTKSDWDVEVVAEATASAIHMAIGDNNLGGVVSLKVKGSINSYDLMIIRNKLVNLRYLDLSEANIVANSYEYYTGYCSHDNMLERYAMPTQLLSLKLPTSLTSLGAYALEGLTKITEITLPDGLLTLGTYAFKNCSKITKMIVPSSVTKIEAAPFSGCSGITEISLPFLGPTNNITTASASTDFGYVFGTVSYSGSILKTQGQIYYSGGYGFNNTVNYYIPSNLKKITIEGGNILNGAFSRSNSVWGNEKLTLIFGKNVKTIQTYAYFNFSINTSTYSDSLIIQGNPVLNKQSFVEAIFSNIVLSDLLEEIPAQAFYSSDVSDLWLGTKLSKIGSKGFSCAEAVKYNLHIKDLESFCKISIADINSNPITGSQYGCQNVYLNDELLENVTLPEGLTEVKPYTFYGFKNLKSINLSNATTIGQQAFASCTSLASITSSTTIETIGTSAFNGCTSLKSLQLSANSIASSAFYGCTSLQSINLSVNKINSSAFYGCKSLTDVSLTNLTALGDAAFQSCTSLPTVALPATVLSIGKNAFNGCTSLVQMNIPASVKSIGTYAFSGCTGLETCVLPTNSNLTAISDYTFNGCSKLQKMDLPVSVKTIGNYAFQNCTAMAEVKIPSGITSIGSYAFGGCTALNDVYTYTIVPQTIDQNTFSTYTTATLHMPAVSYYSYFYDTQWSQFLKLENFDEPYDYVYIDKDFSIYSESAGTIDGNPDVDVATTGGLTVIGNTAQNFSDIHIKAGSTSSASLIGNNNLTANNLYIDIDVKADYWHFFCFPFDVDLTKIEKDGSYIFRRYAPELRAAGSVGWQDIEGTTLQAGQGYIFRTNTAGTLSIPVANPNLSGQNETTTLNEYGDTETTDDNKNWNFIGNRYTAYYDINEMSYTAPIIIWNGTAYAAYRPGDDDLTLTPYQAFFVQKPANVENVEFDKDGRTTYQRSTSTSSSSKAILAKAARLDSNRKLINLAISDGENTDKARVVFNNNQSMEYEMECDASKFISNGEVPLIYSLNNDGIRYAINERPVDNGNVQLGVMIRTAGEYTITAPRMDTSVVLIDKEEDIVHDFANGSYTFSADAGTFENRFVLSVANSNVDGINGIEIESESESAMYDLTGRKATSKQKGILISKGKKVFVK